MTVNKRRFSRGLGLLALGAGLMACGQPHVPPTQASDSLRAEIRQAPEPSVPALQFAPYGSGLVRARWSQTSDRIGNWLYVVGGADGTGAMASVERAPVLEGGHLGPFEAASVTLQVPRDDHASLIIGGWLYIFGGDRQGSLDSIERAPIGPGGALGDFQLTDVRLTTRRDEHTVTRIGRYVYVVGGIRGPVQLASVERAEVRSDGSLGPFAPYSRSLTANRYGHWVVVHEGSLYVVGGLSDNGDASEVERARIGSDGELGPFERTGTRLSEVRDSPIAMGLGGWLYVIAGAREHALHMKLASVEAARFTGGGLGPFVRAGTLQQGRDYHTVNRVDDWIYAIAGEKSGGGAIGTVERARVPRGDRSAQVPATPEVAVTPEATAPPEVLESPEATASPEIPASSEATPTPAPTGTSDAPWRPYAQSAPEASSPDVHDDWTRWLDWRY